MQFGWYHGIQHLHRSRCWAIGDMFMGLTVIFVQLVLRGHNLRINVMEIFGGQQCTKLCLDHRVKELPLLHFIIIMELIIGLSPVGRDVDDLPIKLEDSGSHSRTIVNSRAQSSSQLILWLWVFSDIIIKLDSGLVW